MQKLLFEDLGLMDYQEAWDYQEALLLRNVEAKKARANRLPETALSASPPPDARADMQADAETLPGSLLLSPAKPDVQNDPAASPASDTTHHLLYVEHPPVYTLGKSGNIQHVLLDEAERAKRNIRFYKINRGGDITFHGPGQLVVYPILDLEKFYRDIGKYLRNLEEVIILTLKDYGIKGDRSPGETGVWIDPENRAKARKICAIGVRCSRWITMHGLAFNVNTELGYFNGIIPCGIQDKQVTSLQKELSREIPMQEVKEKVKKYFEEVFGVEII
ncbi:MAG: lipoyl(octanoyl) transferase LipB [Chitinophagaceae bacterium]|nr:lipoyl(octanoyl) transferase LipB [Chitinophagaceae bacterium]